MRKRHLTEPTGRANGLRFLIQRAGAKSSPHEHLLFNDFLVRIALGKHRDGYGRQPPAQDEAK